MQGIYEYIAGKLLEPDSAAVQVKAIMEQIGSLSEMPLRYRLFEAEPWRSEGVHICSAGKYVIFYQPDENGHIVNIIRIMYGGRNIEKQLAE